MAQMYVIAEEPLSVEQFARIEGGDVSAKRKEVTVQLITEIRYHCNRTCAKTRREACICYGNASALSCCDLVKKAEPDLRKRAGC